MKSIIVPSGHEVGGVVLHPDQWLFSDISKALR